MQGTQIAFEFHFSFQKLQEKISLLVPLSYWPNALAAFELLFSYWMMDILVFFRIFEN